MAEERAETRRARVESRLRAALAPSFLEVADESARHRGHAGARESGGGHFRVTIVSERFAALGRLERHRLCYAALWPAFEGDVHALALRALTPEEWGRESAER